jgi:hypothetical protein
MQSAASCLPSPDFLRGASDEGLILMHFSGFHILWKIYSYKFLRPDISGVLCKDANNLLKPSGNFTYHQV